MTALLLGIAVLNALLLALSAASNISLWRENAALRIENAALKSGLDIANAVTRKWIGVPAIRGKS